MDSLSNDNDKSNGVLKGPDAHGQAAMLLVESLIHSLVERSVISLEDAVDIVTVAADVKEEIAFDLGDSAATLQKSLNILNAIARSLSNDL